MNSSLKILGSKVDCFKGYRELYDHILKVYKENMLQKKYVTVNNVHTIIQGYWHPSFQEIINNSFLSLPDGKPLEIVGRLKGNKSISRLFGPTVMEKFIDWGRSEGLSHFFFGSCESTLLKLKNAIGLKYPGAKICGMVSPPFEPVDSWDSGHFVELINLSKPDFIWIGLGAPKQETWMYKNYNNIHHGILFGIGAGFDYLAGNTKHAPAWMKKFALEWLYRLLQEPGRLWKRYFKIIPQFLFFASLDIIRVKIKRKPAKP